MQDKNIRKEIFTEVSYQQMKSIAENETRIAIIRNAVHLLISLMS